MPTISHYKEYSQLHRFARSTTKSVEILMRKNHLDRSTKSQVKKLHHTILEFQHRMEFLADIAAAREDIRHGRVMTLEEVEKALGL